jgi:hypothetical protein
VTVDDPGKAAGTAPIVYAVYEQTRGRRGIDRIFTDYKIHTAARPEHLD